MFSQADKKKPIDYIEAAVKQSGVENLAYYYLGRAYHLNYRFDDAIKAYQHFKANASGSDLKKHPVDHLIEMCSNGKQLLGDLHDLDVLRKKELDAADYYQAYDLSSNGGTLLVEPDDFKTKTDKKKGLNSIIYLSPDRSKLFFASYGDDDKNGKDIYIAYRLPNGAWGKPTNLGPVINTQYDEDYPFYDEPTHTLYYSSQGHNSMGGYDIFKSVYNEAKNTWSTPVNMDFPINTPGDDILFIADTMNQTAFFSSTRSTGNGRIAVYKINILPHAPDFVVVKGNTYGNGSKATSSRITVKDFQTNEVVGVFNSDSSGGNYVMNLTNGGHFIYSVETQNHKTQSESVTLPLQIGLNPIQQFVSYEPNTDRLIITNKFTTLSDSNYLLALGMIQHRAEMEVNVDTTAPKKAHPTVTQPVAINNPQPANPTTVKPGDTGTGPDSSDIAIIDTNGKKGVSNDQVLQIASNDPKQLQDDAQTQKDEASKTIQYAVNKMTESMQLQNAAQQTIANADKITDPKQKQDSLDRANTLKQQAQDAAKKSTEGFEYASQLQIQATVKQKEADHATQYVGRLDSAIKSHSKEATIKKLQAQRDSVEKQDELNAPAVPTAADLVRIQLQNVKQDSVEMVKHNEDLQKDADRLQAESDDYVAQAQKSDNPDEKVALLKQSRDLSNSKKERENEIVQNQQTLVDMHNRYNQLLNQATQLDSISKNNPTALQVSPSDVKNLQTDIKSTQANPNPVAVNNPVQPNPVVTNPVTPSQPNPNPTIGDTSHHIQPGNPTPVVINPVTPSQPNPNPTIGDTSHHTQPSNPTPVVVNPVTPSQPNPNPTIGDTSHHTQPGNPTPVVVNPITPSQPNPNPVAINNLTHTNPTEPGIDTLDHTQPANPNPVAVNNPTHTNPTEPGIDTVDHTQPANPNPTNPTVINPTPVVVNPVTPSQPNPNPTIGDTSHHTQPSNPTPVVVNPVTPSQPNPNPTIGDTSHHIQPSNPTPVVVNPVTPSQPNPTIGDTSHHTQPSNPTPVVVNPVTPSQPNPNPTIGDTSHHAQPSNPTPVVVNPVTPSQPNPNPTIGDTSHHTQPSNPTPVVVNPVTPSQPNPNPTIGDTSHHTQPSNPTPVVINPVTPSQPNPNPTIGDTSHHTQPSNPTPVVVNPVTPSQPNPNPAPTVVADAKYTDPTAAQADKSYQEQTAQYQALRKQADNFRSTSETKC